MRRKRLWAGAAIIAALVLIFALLSTPCLVLREGESGRVIAAYPLANGEEFSITFIHSVNQSPVTDVYQLRGDRIYVVRTVYYAFGAGVQTELGEGESLEYGPDGSMIVSGIDRPIEGLSYIVGTVSDHVLAIGGKQISLRELCGQNTTVRFLRGRQLFSLIFPLS